MLIISAGATIVRPLSPPSLPCPMSPIRPPPPSSSPVNSHWLSWTHHLISRFEDAFDALRRATELDPDNGDILYRTGVCAINQGRWSRYSKSPTILLSRPLAARFASLMGQKPGPYLTSVDGLRSKKSSVLMIGHFINSEGMGLALEEWAHYTVSPVFFTAYRWHMFRNFTSLHSDSWRKAQRLRLLNFLLPDG